MPINTFIKAINKTIAETKYGDAPTELYEPIEYIMALGGKRMRPLLTILATNIYSKNWKKALKPAIAVEVFHNFTLMHDDIMDAAPLRRGKPTVHAKWDNNVAILSGDVMLVNAYELLQNVENRKFKKVHQRFSRTAAEVCEGQQFDMNFSKRNDVSEDEYLEMIKLKTAVLLGFSLELGGIIAGADDNETLLLNEAGTNIGIGFQLKDDILDVYGDPEKFGKQVGGDIIENKKTFLLIEAMNNAKGETKKALEHWLALTDFDKEEKVKAVTEIYNSLNIKKLAEEKMNEYFKKGFDAFEKLNAAPDRKNILIDFARNLIDRES